MLRTVQHFGKHCMCHLQCDCIVFGHFWKSYVRQAVGGMLCLMVLVGGVEEWSTIQWEKSIG
jgi:hypothetical protein